MPRASSDGVMPHIFGIGRHSTVTALDVRPNPPGLGDQVRVHHVVVFGPLILGAAPLTVEDQLVDASDVPLARRTAPTRPRPAAAIAEKYGSRGRINVRHSPSRTTACG
jgi:hypothetical protein